MGAWKEFLIDKGFFGPWTWLFRLLDALVPKDERLVLLGSNHGGNFSDNSRALFEHLAADPRGLRPRWVTKSRAVQRRVAARHPGMVVRSLSIRGLITYLRAKHVFVSHSWLDMSLLPLTPRKRVHYLWHGLPLKRIGHHDPGADDFTTHWKRWNRRADVFYVSSEYEAEVMRTAFAAPDAEVEMTGNPRNDPLYEVAGTEHGVENGGGEPKVVLYAPTWRYDADLEHERSTPLLHPELDEERLHSFLTDHDAKLVIRPHPLAGRMSFESDRIECSTIDDVPDLFSLFVDADVLVTDYSSAHVDWLILDRPVVFSCYDLDGYRDRFGFIGSFEQVVGGPIVKTPEEVLRAISDALRDDGQRSLRAERRRLLLGEVGGGACERIASLLRSGASR